jgi:polysaccharide export outer membrane protein
MLVLSASGQTIVVQAPAEDKGVVRLKLEQLPATPPAAELVAASVDAAPPAPPALPALPPAALAPASESEAVPAGPVPAPAAPAPPAPVSLPAPLPARAAPLLPAPAPVPVPESAAPAPPPIMPPAEPVLTRPAIPEDLLGSGAAAPGPAMITCPPIERYRCGVICDGGNRRSDGPGWAAQRLIPWQVFAQGEYVGPPRSAHVSEYRLRVDDQIEFVYRLTAKQVARPYRLEVGDRIHISSVTAAEINQDAFVEPDGAITLPLLGQVPAASRTLDELRAALDQLYKVQLRAPNIVVTPLKLNTRLEELRSAIDSRYSVSGGQTRRVRVTPEGTVQLPAVGSVVIQGLALSEAKREVEERYAQLVDGLEITPILADRAPRYVFVLGEVRTPGRYTLEGPTTVMQAIALAGSWNVGANLKELVVFRRDDCWRLMATKVNVHGAVFGHQPCPGGEIWLRDSDIVLVPKSSLLATDDLINLLFTRGLYGVMPVTTTMNFTKLTTL